MKQALLAGTILAALILPSVAHADEILAFGQNGTVNTVTIADTGGISTTLTASNIPSGITALFGGGTPAAFFDLDAHSVGAATPLGAGFQQNFAGTFSITSGMGQAGINYLSGSLHRSGIRRKHHPTRRLVRSAGPHRVYLGCDPGIGAWNAPRGVAFSLSNFDPPVGLDGTTLSSSGTASITGTFDSTPAGVPGADHPGSAWRGHSWPGLRAPAASRGLKSGELL